MACLSWPAVRLPGLRSSPAGLRSSRRGPASLSLSWYHAHIPDCCCYITRHSEYIAVTIRYKSPYRLRPASAPAGQNSGPPRATADGPSAPRWIRTTPPRGARRCPATSRTAPTARYRPEAQATGQYAASAPWRLLVVFGDSAKPGASARPARSQAAMTAQETEPRASAGHRAARTPAAGQRQPTGLRLPTSARATRNCGPSHTAWPADGRLARPWMATRRSGLAESGAGTLTSSIPWS
jgi:hypothetical protein